MAAPVESTTSASQVTLNSLAAKITELSADFTRFLEDNKINAPTFAADSPTSYSNLTTESFVLRQQLSDALMDMWYLTQGPSESIFNYVHTCMPDVATLHILNHFDFWAAVPLDGSASLAEIAKHVELPEDVVRRVLEHATTLRLFEEQASGKIAHTSRSAALAKSSGLRALVATFLEDAAAPMTVMPQALEKHSRGKKQLSGAMNETAFAMVHSGGMFGNYANSWELIENDGEGEKKGWRQKNFVEFMRYLKEIFHLEQVILGAYDWQAAGNASIVDIGGSGGHDDFALAEKFPNLTITVQDLPKVQSSFESNRPKALEKRVTFMPHDFFQPQPIEADIYVIKLILHDWPEKECIQILQALRPALKKGSRILFIDYLATQEKEESASIPRSIKQMGTATDIRMMALFNAAERPVAAWREIFRKADERFDIVRVEANPLSFHVILEVVWRG